MATITSTSAGFPTEIARALVDDLEALTDELVGLILTGDHAYAETTLLSLDELRGIVHDNVESVLRQLCGEADPELESARAAGRLKAGYGVPLAALLHAYRLGGRLVWDRLRVACEDRPDLLPGIGADVWRIIDDYSTAAAEEYGRTVAERIQRDAESRRVELRALLDGVVDAGRLHTAAVTLQLPAAGTFLVVSAEPVAGGEPLAGVEGLLRELNVTSHWLSDVHARVGLLSLPGAHSAQTVRDLLARSATGRVGVSRPFPAPVEAPAALRQAELARCTVEPGSATVRAYGEAAVPLLLAHSPEAGRELRDAVLGPVLALPEADRAALLDTLDAWFETGGSPAATAERMHYHRNTINHRLRRVEELTGRDRSDPRGAAELYLALRAQRMFS